MYTLINYILIFKDKLKILDKFILYKYYVIQLINILNLFKI